MSEHEYDSPEPEPPNKIVQVFAGILATLIMLVVILGLLNVFCEWAFGWSVQF